MSRCVSPLSGWVAAKPNDSGRHGIVFGLHGAYADCPVDLPCGQCVGCKQDRSEAWSVRCYHESTQHLKNCFLTLTYRDPCPATLNVADVQKFIKRLRKAGFKFRYFGVGEYGSQTRRPHYHFLIFGEDFREGSFYFGCGEKSENRYYLNEALQAMWGLGNITLAECEGGSIFYTCGYQLKALDGEGFHIYSKKPAIGHGWLEKYHDDLLRNNFLTIEGKKFSIPTSYLRKKGYELIFDGLKDDRREYARTMDAEEKWKKRSSARSRETNIKAKAKANKGEL